MKQHYCIVNDTVKENLIAYIRTLPVNPRAPMVVDAREETRTDKQNRLMWPLLKDLSDQVVWHGEKLTREESGEPDPGPGAEIRAGHQRRPGIFRRPHIQIQQALHGRRHRGDLLVRYRPRREVLRSIQ